jgi:ribosomal protein S4
MKKNVHVQEWVQQSAYFPSYLIVDRDNLKVTFDRLPEQGEVQTPVDIQLVVEFYNRLT